MSYRPMPSASIVFIVFIVLADAQKHRIVLFVQLGELSALKSRQMHSVASWSLKLIVGQRGETSSFMIDWLTARGRGNQSDPSRAQSIWLSLKSSDMTY